MVVQVITVIEQELRKLRQNFPQGIRILQFHEGQWAATVLEGSASLACGADGILFRGVKRKDLFETNLVLPPVRQIILIDKRFLAAEMEITQLHSMGIVVKAHPSRLPHSVGLSPNEELVQVFIHPAEYDLQGVMKLSYRAVAPHEQATPDLGTDLPYPDAQLIDLNGLVGTLHFSPPLLDFSSCTPL
jgi:hypothetical protein